MESYVFWTFVLAVAALLAAGVAVFVRAYVGGTMPSALFFRPKAERRLEVVELASLDSRRKLVLIRRDDVEHLLLTGGPVDVVVETGIAGAVAKQPVQPIPPKETSVERRPPVFGRARAVAEQDPGARDL